LTNHKTIPNVRIWLLLLTLMLCSCSQDNSAQSSSTPEPTQASADASTTSDNDATPLPPQSSVSQPLDSKSLAHNVRAQTAALLEAADDLLATATQIAADTPQTSLEGAAMVGGDQGIAGQFYARDHAFQATLDGQKLGLIMDPSSQSAVLNLLQAESFLYAAVVATVASCNAHDAQLNLKVARADIAEAHRDFHGNISDSFEPPDITSEESGSIQCDQ
jgi:hypothetical protein